jgi:hypothetical protein
LWHQFLEVKFFTKFVVFISLISFIAELSYTSAIFVDYLANQSYYSNVLCVNKDKPELACKGQCILMQKLSLKSHQRTDKKQKQIVEILDLFENLYFEGYEDLLPDQNKLVVGENEKIPTHLLKHHSGHTQNLLDPPKYLN